MSAFLCNLSEVHLNQVNPLDLTEQENCFKVAGLIVSGLLHHEFSYPELQYSRKVDPIVGASATGIFDFFVNLFGVEWLVWWKRGRGEYIVPLESVELSYIEIEKTLLERRDKHHFLYLDYVHQDSPGEYTLDLNGYFTKVEQVFFTFWRETVEKTVKTYCERNNLRVPNRCTTVKPSGTGSLLTGASPGWHPPKAARFIRRITFSVHDHVALACRDFGYNIVPSVGSTDEEGHYIKDINDPRVKEWLVEIPVEVPWAALADKAEADPNQFSFEAQFSFLMQMQKYYVRQNTSATLEYRQQEIPKVTELIYNAIQNNEGYISAAMMARFDDFQSHPLLPFEPITESEYLRLQEQALSRRKAGTFYEFLEQHDKGEESTQEIYVGGCDSEKCSIKF